MKRGPFFLSLLAVAIGWAAPGCSGSEFTGTSGGNEAGDSGEPSGGNSGASGSSTGGSDSGGEPGGGNGGNGGNGVTGGKGGSSTGGSSTGGDAGEETGGTGNGGTANGGNGNGGMGGRAGASGSGTGGGGVSGMAGRAGSGGIGGGASGSGGSVGGGSGGKGGTGGAGKGGTAGTAGSGGTAGTSGTAGSGGAMPVGCPINAPALGSMCTYQDFCMYGAHPLGRCRQILDCIQGQWQETQGACGAPPNCSVSPEPPVVGEQCNNDGFQCRADQNVFCMCASGCSGTICTTPIWHCFGPPQGCPVLLPNHGQTCSGTMSCTYGTCPTGTSIVATCSGGLWRWQNADCPVTP